MTTKLTIDDITYTVGDVLIQNCTGKKFTFCFGAYRDSDIECLDTKANDYDDIYYDEETKDDCNYGFYIQSEEKTFAWLKSLTKYYTKEQ